MADIRSVTTHAILESLGLIEQVNPDPEAEFKYTSPEDARSPTISTNSPSSRIFSGSEGPSISDTMSSILYQTTTNGGDMSSPKSVDCMGDLQFFFTEAPLITTPSWQSLPNLTTANGFQDFGSHHTMPSLFGTELLEEITLPSSTWITDTTSTVHSHNDSICAVFHSLPSYQAPTVRIGSPERDQLEAAREAFGFDPVPSPPKNDSAEIAEVETINGWPDFRKHAEYGSGSDHSVCVPACSDMHSWIGSDLSTISTDPPSHSSIASLKELDHKPTSEHSSTHLPPPRRKGRPRLEQSNELTNFASTSTHKGSKRGRKRYDYSTASGQPTSEGEKRRISLEQNRRAASRSREKKRHEILQLQEASHDSAAENRLLKKQTTKMREETAKLRSELLSHMSHGGCHKPDEVRRLLDTSLDREVMQATWSKTAE